MIGMARFQLGRIVATPNALSQVPPDEMLRAIACHQGGNWGEVTRYDWQANETALDEGSRLLSVYRTVKGVKFWVITEADRSVTTILLPEDY